MGEPLVDEVDDLLTRERRRQDRERLGVLVMVLGLVAGGVVLALGRSGLPGGETSDALLVAAAGVSIMAAITTLAFRPGKEARQLEALIGRRDQMQRGRNDRIYALSIAAWGMLAGSLAPLIRIAEGRADGSDVFFVATLPLLASLILMSVGGWTGFGKGRAREERKWREDEFTRAARSRAMALGFPLLTMAMGAVFLLGLYKAEWAVVAMPFGLIGAASAVGLRFAWLDRQAEAGKDG